MRKDPLALGTRRNFHKLQSPKTCRATLTQDGAKLGYISARVAAFAGRTFAFMRLAKRSKACASPPFSPSLL